MRFILNCPDVWTIRNSRCVWNICDTVANIKKALDLKISLRLIFMEIFYLQHYDIKSSNQQLSEKK